MWGGAVLLTSIASAGEHRLKLRLLLILRDATIHAAGHDGRNECQCGNAGPAKHQNHGISISIPVVQCREADDGPQDEDGKADCNADSAGSKSRGCILLRKFLAARVVGPAALKAREDDEGNHDQEPDDEGSECGSHRSAAPIGTIAATKENENKKKMRTSRGVCTQWLTHEQTFGTQMNAQMKSGRVREPNTICAVAIP